MQTIKCSSCSANVKLTENSNVTICPYCGSSIILNENEKIIVKSEPKAETYTAPQVTNIPPRPKATVWLAVLLCLTYFWPGVIYLCIIDSKQRAWDKQYKNK